MGRITKRGMAHNKKLGYVYIYIYINLLKIKLLVHIENAHYSEIPKSLKKILQHSAALKMLQQKKK